MIPTNPAARAKALPWCFHRNPSLWLGIQQGLVLTTANAVGYLIALGNSETVLIKITLDQGMEPVTS